MTMQGVTVESLGEAYTELSAAIAPVVYGKRPEDVIAALLLIAMLVEKHRAAGGAKGHRQAVLDLVGKIYDMATHDTLAVSTGHAVAEKAED